MQYIFNHEKLRLDEIMRKVSTRNHFSPLKPLKTLSSAIPNTKSAKTKKLKKSKISNTYKIPPINEEYSSVFPLLSKWYYEEIPEINSKKKNSDAKKFGVHYSIQASPLSKEKRIRYFSSEKRNNNHSALPKINTYPKHKNLSCDLDYEINNKKSSGVIAYVPSVSYISDKEELANIGLEQRLLKHYKKNW